MHFFQASSKTNKKYKYNPNHSSQCCLKLSNSLNLPKLGIVSKICTLWKNGKNIEQNELFHTFDISQFIKAPASRFMAVRGGPNPPVHFWNSKKTLSGKLRINLRLASILACYSLPVSHTTKNVKNVGQTGPNDTFSEPFKKRQKVQKCFLIDSA